MKNKIYLRAGRHYGPEGIGDILDKFYKCVWLARLYIAADYDVEILCDWSHTPYTDLNIFPILFANEYIMGIKLITDSIDIQNILSDYSNFEGGVHVGEMNIANSTYAYHGIELRYKCVNNNLFVIWNKLAEKYNVLATGQYQMINTDYYDRKRCYADLELTCAVQESLKFILYDNINYDDILLGIHYRHGNGELPIDEQYNIDKIVEILKKYIIDFNINFTKIFFCTDSNLLANTFKSVTNYDIITIDRDYLEHGEGALHRKGYATLDSCIRDCAEMIALAKCDNLLYNYSFFNYYANLVGHFEHSMYIPYRGGQQR